MDPVAVARSLADEIRASADRAEQLRRLPPELAVRLRDAGLFRLCVPAVYGGPECDPMTLVRTIATTAEADGAAGWCVMIASTTSSMAAFLDPDWARVMFGTDSTCAAGALAPSGHAERIDGGWRVSGRWAWGSGTGHADWIAGGALDSDGGVHLLFFDATDVTFLDTWHSSGLRGTGSTDFEVEAAVVPSGRAVHVGVDGPRVDGPLAQFPNFTLLATGVAAALLGIARRAVTEIVALATVKQPVGSSKTLATSSLTQVDVARAEALVRSATSYLLDELASAWDVVVAGGKVAFEQRASIRLAAVTAAEHAVQAVDLAYQLGGGSSVFLSNPLQRCLRDVRTGSQHVMVSRRMLETVGRWRLGQPVEGSMV